MLAIRKSSRRNISHPAGTAVSRTPKRSHQRGEAESEHGNLPFSPFLPIFPPFVGIPIERFPLIEGIGMHERPGTPTLGWEIVGGLIDLERERLGQRSFGRGCFPALVTREPLAGVVA